MNTYGIKTKGNKIKIDYKKLKNKSLFIFADGRKPKNDEELVDMIKYCLDAIGRGQNTRHENIVGEIWGLEALNEIMDCVVYKHSEPVEAEDEFIYKGE